MLDHVEQRALALQRGARFHEPRLDRAIRHIVRGDLGDSGALDGGEIVTCGAQFGAGAAMGAGEHAEQIGIPAERGVAAKRGVRADRTKSEEHTSELQTIMRNSYAVFCLKKKKS